MGQQFLPAVDRLQQQKIGNLGDAPRAGLGEARRERLAALVQHAGELGDQAGKRHRGGADQCRRDPLVVEPGAPVGGDLDDAGEADAVVARALVGFEQIA